MMELKVLRQFSFLGKTWSWQTAKRKLKASQRQLFNKNRLLPTLDLFKK